MDRLLRIESCDECPYCGERIEAVEPGVSVLKYGCYQEGPYHTPVLVGAWEDRTKGTHPNCPLPAAGLLRYWTPVTPETPVPENLDGVFVLTWDTFFGHGWVMCAANGLSRDHIDHRAHYWYRMPAMPEPPKEAT